MMTSLITLDVDWAPDFILEYVSDLLITNNIKSTWFITHKSKYIDHLKQNKHIELGIHPNFLENSTQGKTNDEILKNLKAIVPNSISVRTHALSQSTHQMMIFQKYGLKIDLSLLLYKTKNLEPHYNPMYNLYRIPYFWEDDVEMSESNPDWSIKKISRFIGLKVYDFHPIHIFLNSPNLDRYNKFKSDIQLEKVNEVNIKKYVNSGVGTRTFFLDLINELKKGETLTVKDYFNKNMNIK